MELMCVLSGVYAASRLLGFIGLKILFYILQEIVYRLNGVYRHRGAIRSGTTDRVVEVHKVIAKLPIDIMSVTTTTYYILWHVKFISVEDLNPDVVLYFVSEEEVYLVDCEEPEELFNTRRFPFYELGQFAACTHMLTLPWANFIKVAEKVGDPKCKTHWIFHTTRCGSTAMCQALYTVPGMTVISEPSHLELYLARLAGRQPDWMDTFAKSKEFESLCIACIRFLLRRFDEDDRVCIKVRGAFEYYAVLPVLCKHYPEHRIISMYRDAKGIANSLYKTYDSLIEAYITLVYWLVDTFGFQSGYLEGIRHSITNGMLPHLDRQSDDRGYKYDLFYLSFLYCISDLIAMRETLPKVKYLKLLLFDDFLTDMKGELEKVFQFLNIPTEQLPAALEALKADSQKGSPYAQGNGKSRGWLRNEQVVSACNKLLSKYHLPAFGVKYRINADFGYEETN